MLGGIFKGVLGGVGAVLQGQANKKAASIAADASYRAAELQADALRDSTKMQVEAGERSQAEMRAAADRGIGAIRAGTVRFMDTMQPLTQRQAEFYNPNFRLGLTPNQTIAREDMLRQGRASIAKSGLRGAGRAGASAILDADRRFLAAAAADNDQLNRNAEMTNINLRDNAANRRDAATSDIARMYAQEGGAIANTELMQGNRIAESMSDVGRATAADTRQIGRVEGQAVSFDGLNRAATTTRNAELYSDAIGQVGGSLANMFMPTSLPKKPLPIV
jgi:hypothetical protein